MLYFFDGRGSGGQHIISGNESCREGPFVRPTFNFNVFSTEDTLRLFCFGPNEASIVSHLQFSTVLWHNVETGLRMLLIHCCMHCITKVKISFSLVGLETCVWGALYISLIYFGTHYVTLSQLVQHFSKSLEPI